ncbi:MAG TPA: dTDP-4-dehydrorhamnose reductase [Deltaproteobacteria bacterium]|nr:dTDP-4-dehydrorhamnose reductase [Deltaproteobacteria bacterium]HPR53965.1 dTDP-4-dehydrorhamnose reductase [Deltaproteobacteria bacterium]HXK46412.1 dTDP-4-dehydrorhamnose reductase [Deltaproteobacteria bacterium]
MKILVTGAGGMLGHDVVQTLEMQGHEVWGTDVASSEEKLDITKPDQIRYAIASFRPEWIVNCAAYTNVDGAEEHEDTAILLNAKGPEMLSRACRRHSVKLLHISTDYVFDGEKDTPYSEDDPPGPINFYGVSKLAGENAVRHQMTEYLIVRTQWLIGHHGRNFISTILAAAQVKETLQVVNDQWGSPTFAPDLAKALAHLMEIDARGIFHVCNRGKTTWYDLASKAIEFVGLGTKVVPVATSEYPRPARRPRYSILSTTKFTEKTGKVMPLWQTSLGNHVREYLQHAKGSA